MSYPPVPYPSIPEAVSASTTTCHATPLLDSDSDPISVAQSAEISAVTTQDLTESPLPSAHPRAQDQKKRSRSSAPRHGVRAPFKKHRPVLATSSSPVPSSYFSRSKYSFSSDSEDDLPTFQPVNRGRLSPTPDPFPVPRFVEFSVPRPIDTQNSLLTVGRHSSSAQSIYEQRITTLERAVRIQKATDIGVQTRFDMKWLDGECETWKKVGRLAAKQLYEILEPPRALKPAPIERKDVSSLDRPKDEGLTQQEDDFLKISRDVSHMSQSSSEDELMREVNEMIVEAQCSLVARQDLEHRQNDVGSASATASVQAQPSESPALSSYDHLSAARKPLDVPDSDSDSIDEVKWTLADALASVEIDAKLFGWNSELGIFL
ncbi:hypothetical protein ACM66B_004639 [Microbotryomycetes sp. NB124-2]